MRRPTAFTLIEMLVTIAVIGILASLLLPAVQQARESARRQSCRMNLQQLALALGGYESALGVLPPGVVDTSDPLPAGGGGARLAWTVQILPWIEQGPLHDAVNTRQSATAPANAAATAVGVALLVCPSLPTNAPADCHFAGIHDSRETSIAGDNNGVLFLNSAVSTEDMHDDRAYTLLLGEKVPLAGEAGWAVGGPSTLRNTGTPPADMPTYGAVWRRQQAVAPPPGFVGGFSSPHSGGTHFAFCDGSVRFVGDQVDASILRRLADRTDGAITPLP